MTGTAAELIPIVKVDGRTIGEGKPGPVTKKLLDAFHQVRLRKTALNMTCDICGKKKATVHLTEIVDEQMSEMHLCEECARQKSTQMEQQFGLADLLAGLI